MDFTRIKYLLRRYNNGELTKDEWEEFRTLLASDDFMPVLSDDMMKTFSELRKPALWDEFNHRHLEETISLAHVKSSPVISLRKHWGWVAAAIILVISTVVFISREKNSPAKNGMIAEQTSVEQDISPAKDRAVLTLSDGSTIYIDSASSGTLAMQGSSTVKKLDNGEIVYSAGKTNGNKILYNTMTTPRGGHFTLVLPDGSKVWMNAASSITYPTAFAGNDRQVSIAGEVYFEVTPDKSRPFIVNTRKESITVLGTHFNVNAYADESSIKTSLIEGKVKIGEKVLQPGEAFVNGNVVATNIAQDVAWKNGVFDFDDVEFAAGLRQLARWYDLEIQYHIPVPGIRFGGRIDRNLTLSQVLKVIDGVGAHFELEGKVLHVKS